MRIAKDTDLTSYGRRGLVEYVLRVLRVHAGAAGGDAGGRNDEHEGEQAPHTFINRLWEPGDGYPGVTQTALRSAYMALSRGSAS